MFFYAFKMAVDILQKCCRSNLNFFIFRPSSTVRARDQKINIVWPQQPPTEKVLKFNMIFYNSTLKNFFSRHKDKAELRCLDDSEVLSSFFFQVLNPLQPR